MLRIKALNQRNSEHQQLDTSISVLTEKIIEEIKHQYTEALTAKHNGQYDVAIEIFQQILHHDETTSVTAESKAREQIRLKYCCYKNLAEVYNAQKSYRAALEMFLQAYAMDNTDVHFLSKFARIALEQRHIDLAGAIFDRCLELNSNHIPSMDGVLEMLCHREDYFEAYGWAVHCHSKFPKYQRAIDVICDAYNILGDTTMLQAAFSLPFNVHGIINKRSSKPSLFPSATNIDDDDDDVMMYLDVPDFTQFRINAVPSFLTFGHMIELIYAKSTQVTSYLTTKLSLSNICDVNNVNVDSNNANITENLSKPMSHNFDESCATTAATMAVCNSQPIMLSTTSPFQAIFHEIVPQYFSIMDDDNDNFAVQFPSIIRAITQPNYLKDVEITSTTSNETFHNVSARHFQSFIDTLKDCHQFCMLDITFEWLKWFSKCYRIQLPIKLQSLYCNIFEYQCQHNDYYGNWENLSHEKINDLLAMEIFYIELKIASNVRESTVEQPRFFDHRLTQRLHNLFYKRTLFIRDDCDPTLHTRLLLLRFQMSIAIDEDFELANDLLNHINTYLIDAAATPDKCIHLPNQLYCKLVDRRTIGNEMELIKCLQQLQQLERRQWHQWQMHKSTLELLLTHRQCNFESKYLNRFQQIEMLVEWHWCAERFDECLHWCEIGLNESIRIWMLQCKQSDNNGGGDGGGGGCGKPVPKQFSQHIRFLTVYLEHFYDEHPNVLKSLDNKNKKRLFRSMAHLLDIQYDDRRTAVQIASSQHNKTLPSSSSLFNSTKLVNILNLILNSDQHYSNAMDAQWAVLNIITKIAERLILNNIPTSDDCEFLMCVWHMLLNSYANNNISSSSSYCCNSIGTEFNWTEIIRLLSHSIYGYPNDIERHCGVCTCKRVQIDWNGATLLFKSFDSISNGMSQLERKSLIDDLLNTIPDDLQMNLLEAISQLTNFLNDAIDFPHKTIPMRSIPIQFTEIFYRIANSDIDMANYGPYNREQIIAMDLAINPQRYGSWLELLRMKIGQFDKFYDAIDLTEINFVDVENAKNAIDTCFNKCQMFNRAETISTVDHLWYYGLYSYKLSNFFTKANDGGGNGGDISISSISSSSGGAVMRNEFNGIYTPKRYRSMFSWNRVSKLLNAYYTRLTKCSPPFIDTQQKFRCYFMLGKMAEKQNPMAIEEALKFYLMAEQQLYDQQQAEEDDGDNNNNDRANDDDTDDTLIQTKIEMNFRITASIYKFVVRRDAGSVNNASNTSTSTDAATAGAADVLLHLMQLLQRDKSRLFSKNQLAKRAKRMELLLVDENANKVHGVEQQQQQQHHYHQNQVNSDIIKLCTDDFEWYLELCPTYYKAVYYLAKINLTIDDSKCRGLLLQLPRKANENVEKKLSLFEVHRNRHLFKVKNAAQLDVIHSRASFNKYMEKCVKILIEYLATKRNPHILFVLALQWCRLASQSATSAAAVATTIPLNRQQINRLFEMILKQFLVSSSTYVQLTGRNASKSKAFGDFYQNLYELYKACEQKLRRSTSFSAYSKLMITCHRLCGSSTASAIDDNGANNDDELQKAVDFGAKKMDEKAESTKNAKKQSKDTQQTQEKLN